MIILTINKSLNKNNRNKHIHNSSRKTNYSIKNKYNQNRMSSINQTNQLNEILKSINELNLNNIDNKEEIFYFQQKYEEMLKK